MQQRQGFHVRKQNYSSWERNTQYTALPCSKREFPHLFESQNFLHRVFTQTIIPATAATQSWKQYHNLKLHTDMP